MIFFFFLITCKKLHLLNVNAFNKYILFIFFSINISATQLAKLNISSTDIDLKH